MNINFKFLLLGTSLSLIPALTYAQCAVTDCLQLGYTSLKKCDNGLKCPFGEYWACPKVEEKAVLGQCTGYAKNCTIGDILNSDGTCTTDNNKIPLGVVVAIKDNCGYAMTASPIAINIKWSTEYVSTGTFCSGRSELALGDFDVNGNMTKIIQYAENKHGDKAADYYPAVYVALNYVPSNASATKGKWALPSAGIFDSLYKNRNIINNTISKLGGAQLTGDNIEHIWSSSEYDQEEVWVFCMSGGGCWNGVNNWYAKDLNGLFGSHNNVVRPVIEF